MIRNERGYTMLEILFSTVIISVVMGGILSARLTAGQIQRSQRNVSFAEASGYAQQTAERFHNDMACDNAALFDANCDVDAPALPGWTADPMPGGGSESIMTIDPAARRCWRMLEAPPGTCGAAECIQVEVKVCWNGTVCPC
jgi:prepilin-type N-terminal cleavage/methylation domain-containing protein